jgi:hypothetical protein
LRRPPAIILDDSDEDEEPEPPVSDGHQDNDVDKEGSSDEDESNNDLQELGSASLKEKMASEVCNLLILDLILSYI